jgi:hypothetical protein
LTVVVNSITPANPERNSYDGMIPCNLETPQMVYDSDDPPNRPDDPGLCRTCQHSRRMESDRGSVFIRCELSLEGSRFPKYPRLPVLVCSGYRPKSA